MFNLRGASLHLQVFAEVTSGSCRDNHGERYRHYDFQTLPGPQNLLQDMNRFASPVIRVGFDGVDLQEETLYHTFRVFLLSIRNNTRLIPITSHMVA